MLSSSLSILLFRTGKQFHQRTSVKIDSRSLSEPIFLATSLSVVTAEAELMIPVIYLTSPHMRSPVA
jgi:hypothetical protein